jgi:DNA-binding NtrC family response regulator
MEHELHSPRTVVVVEDDREQRNLIVALLEETDLLVVDVDSAEAALHYMRQRADEVALVFTDVRLPCLMDGVGLACAVHANWPWISILVTSGYGGSRLDVLPATAMYLPKPWRALDVLVEADRASKRHREHRNGLAA